MEKPGIATTEFWLSIIAMVLVNLPQAFIENPPQWVTVAGLIGSALIAMGYGVSRALTKSNSTGVNVEWAPMISAPSPVLEKPENPPKAR